MVEDREGAALQANVYQRDAGPAVDVNGIARRFGRKWALRGVSLRVEPGEVVAIVGRNGSGKTTLLRILATLLRPTRGEGRIYGHDLVSAAAEIRELVGLLGHAPGIYGDLTAQENLVFALRMMGRTPDRSAVLEALEAVGLAREAGERARHFSAGMQRRLALARMLLQRPRLILLDEPYASFDPEGIERVNAFLKESAARGAAALVATHDLARAAAVVDRVVRMDAGALVEEPWTRPAETGVEPAAFAVGPGEGRRGWNG